MSLEIVKVNSFIRGYHEYKIETEWEPSSGDVYRLMREPDNVNDSTVAAVVRKITDDVETGQTVFFFKI